MHLFRHVGDRKSAETAPAAAFYEPGKGPDDAVQTAGTAHSDSDTISLEAANEKEVQEHPDQVTQGAQLGVQKVEAAALVWSQKTVYATYGM